ncbi:hypothetical protein GCM10025791_32700 [Halioxenophilus aromaticivorans]|uniref:CSLREA domain-containing protein n=2 Tax=Halioxenophilus aromaticivorans TaxID=1306992 RepID=A0AAV3U5R8_9ALTE
MLTTTLLSACTVNLTDETGPNLAVNPPINLQTFEADVTRRGGVTIDGVTVALDGGATQPLTGVAVDGNGVGTWRADVSVAPCEELVSYRFSVDYSAPSSRTKVFPEEGSFVQPISGTDPLCDNVISASKTFTVNSYEDLPDGNPGDGFCNITNASNDGTCTLRAAVMEANARSGVDLIRVPTGRYTLTREKTGSAEADDTPEDAWGDLDITDSVAIVGIVGDSIHIGRFMQTQTSSVGPGGYLVPVVNFIDRPNSNNTFVKIDGGEIDRVFDIHVGSTDSGFAFFNKIAVLNGHINDRPGGGILNQGRLRLSRVAVYDNRLSQGSGGAGGVFSQNKGAGIANLGVLVAEELALVNNRILGTTGFAGALWANANSSATINNSLLALNQARFSGAIYVDNGEDGSAAGSVALTNTTVAYNSNSGSSNNAINNHGSLTLNFVTLVQNNRGGLASNAGSLSSVSNSLLANNGSNQDCDSGTVNSSGGNIIKDNGCTIDGAQLSPDLVDFSGSVIADSLRHQGGFTYVIPIRPPFDPSSSIIDPTDRISAAIPKPDFDQRGSGFDRAIDADGSGDAEMDPGAYEYSPR